MDRNVDVGLNIEGEVVLEKYEGEYKYGDKPIEVVRISKEGKVVSKEFHPPLMDSSLAVNAQVLGVDNASN